MVRLMWSGGSDEEELGRANDKQGGSFWCLMLTSCATRCSPIAAKPNNKTTKKPNNKTTKKPDNNKTTPKKPQGHSLSDYKLPPKAL